VSVGTTHELDDQIQDADLTTIILYPSIPSAISYKHMDRMDAAKACDVGVDSIRVPAATGIGQCVCTTTRHIVVCRTPPQIEARPGGCSDTINRLRDN
jgi:phosphoglycerate dehydrogenase-like enzyme